MKLAHARMGHIPFLPFWGYKKWHFGCPNQNWEFYPGGLEFSYLPRIHKYRTRTLVRTSIVKPKTTPFWLQSANNQLSFPHNISPRPPIIIPCSVYRNCQWRSAGVEAGQSIYGSWVSMRILILRDRIPNSHILPRIHK